jgi:hypothetical protein
MCELNAQKITKIVQKKKEAMQGVGAQERSKNLCDR